MQSRAEILVVDDTPANLDLLKALLEYHHYTVRVASSGRQALDIVAERRPDLILLDVDMPTLNGYVVCKKLKANAQTCDIPIIFVSAHTDTDDKIRGFDVGGVDYIARPFHMEEVLARVESHLALQIQRQQLQEHNQEIMRQHQQEIDHLDETNRLKDDFVQTISHDLKTPISLIVGYVDLLIERSLVVGDEGRLFLEQIRQGAEQMHAMVVNLLDLTHLEQGHIITPIITPLGQFMATSILLFEMAALEKNIALHVHLNDETQMIEIDPTRFEQVMHNLLSNAMKFTPEGGRIDVACHVYNNQLELAVEDTGMGIAEEDIPHLFDKFFRGSHQKYSKPTIEGTGLGLAIVHAIVEQHHGTIEVESTLGQGTRFVVKIPTRQPRQTQVEAQSGSGIQNSP